MKKGFTLLEVAVAVALLGIMLLSSGLIFKVSIKAFRTACANNEIMQKFRAITDQLNSDFKGLRKDAPLLIKFQKRTNDPTVRLDEIMFFADGEFSSIQLYDGDPAVLDSYYPSVTGAPIRGNLARIYYGHAQSRDPVSDIIKVPRNLEGEDRVLARRLHILTADPKLVLWPVPNTLANPISLDNSFDPCDPMSEIYIFDATYRRNEIFEHDRLPLAQWKNLGLRELDKILKSIFLGGSRPWIDLEDYHTLHKYMCAKVSSFAVQWAYWESGVRFEELRWYPSIEVYDPVGGTEYSHFGWQNSPDWFCVLFNIPPMMWLNWYNIGRAEIKSNPLVPSSFSPDFYPQALKFTFRIHDSKGVIKGGREFTHIVWTGK